MKAMIKVSGVEVSGTKVENVVLEVEYSLEELRAMIEVYSDMVQKVCDNFGTK